MRSTDIRLNITSAATQLFIDIFVHTT